MIEVVVVVELEKFGQMGVRGRIGRAGAGCPLQPSCAYIISRPWSLATISRAQT
jgi:hypothetical protein